MGRESQPLPEQPDRNISLKKPPVNSGILVDFEQHIGEPPHVNSVNAENRWVVGIEETGQCVYEQVQVSHPEVYTSIYDPVGIHVPQAMRETV